MGSVSLKNWLEIGYKKLEAQKAQETGMDTLFCDCLQTDAGPDIAHVVIITQRAQNFFNMFAHLSASADFRVTEFQPHLIQMRGQSPAPLSCLKWGDDGELSAHDTALLVNRLASSEKSRRGFKDHFERRRLCWAHARCPQH